MGGGIFEEVRAPPLEIYYSSLFHFGGAMREPAEGRARRKNSKNFRLPEPRGILRAWTTLCRDPFIFLSSFSFFSLRPTRVESPPGNSVISWKILDGEGGLNREP